MSNFTNKTLFAALIVIVLAFETTEAFYRHRPGLVEDTINQILKKQLERRFGPLVTQNWVTASQPSTETTTTLPRSGSEWPFDQA